MKTLSFKFVFELLLAFAIFSFILYSLEVSQFLFPHFPIVATILYTEKNTRKRIIYTALATLIYSQAASPLPFVFVLTAATQIYILTVAFFASTAFDYSLTALINAIFVSLQKTGQVRSSPVLFLNIRLSNYDCWVNSWSTTLLLVN